MTEGKTIIVRGGGDIASGTIHRLHSCGYRVLILESESPTAIRRTVAFCEAIFSGQTEIEGVMAVHAPSLERGSDIWEQGKIPVLVDPMGMSISSVQPLGVIDAIIAKKNLGTSIKMASITIGLGPGFTAGKDVNAVIETARGHNLGRVIYRGQALPDTGQPGVIEGYSGQRVVYAPVAGTLKVIRDIGTPLEPGAAIASIDGTTIFAPMRGLVRGMLRDGSQVRQGLKIADIDPRVEEVENCYTISDKARCISGGVLEALLFLSRTLSKGD